MRFLVSTHQGKLYDEELDHIIVHMVDNEFAILKDHIPLVCVIPYGYIKMVLGNDVLYLALSNGVLEFKNNVATIIAQEAHAGKSEDSARDHLNAIRKDLQENFLMVQPQQKKSKLKVGTLMFIIKWEKHQGRLVTCKISFSN